MTLSDRPMITFALLAYNQERFIDEAVQGALSQTYTPLEIILSDDCSSDRTFDILRKRVEQYKGPHRVVLNLNSRNMGMGAHMNKVMELSKGDLIVGAAGDDISFPHRTSVIYESWKENGYKAMSLYSDAHLINKDGEVIEHPSPKGSSLNGPREVLSLGKGVAGCTHAWQRCVFDTFGPLPDSTVLEDRAISFRSSLLGTIQFIDKKLVKYRFHGNNVTAMRFIGEKPSKREINAYKVLLVNRVIDALDSHLHDLETAKERNIINASEWRDINDIIMLKIRGLEYFQDFNNRGVGQKIRALHYLWKHKNELEPVIAYPYDLMRLMKGSAKGRFFEE